MYKNLNAEMSRNNIKQRDLLKVCEIKSESTISQKFNKKIDFTLKECKMIKDFLNELSDTNLTIDYLFEDEK
jgi:hypothetical protein